MGESFQTGINNFLKKFEYANAVTQDLWNELTAAWAGSVPEGEKVNFKEACIVQFVMCHSFQKDTKEEWKLVLFVILTLILPYYCYPYHVSAMLFSFLCYSFFPGGCWGHHEHLDPADGLPCGDSEALSPRHLHSLPGTLLAGPKCRIRVSF